MTQFYTVARKLGYLPAFLVCLLFGAQRSWAQTPYPLASGTYNEKFDAISTWEANFAGGTGADRFGVASPQPTLPNTNTVFATGSGGGVQKGAGAIVLLATGTTDGQNASAFDLYLNFTGSAAGSISLDWAEVNNSTGNRQATFKLQTNTGANGTFVDLPGSNVVVTNNIATSGSLTSISLPAEFANKPDAKIRFFLVTSSGGATGSRPKFSIDNLVVTGTTSDTPAPTTTITTTTPATASSYCVTTASGAALSVAFTTTGSFTGDFKAQLSNAAGVFPSNTTDNIIGMGASSPIAAIIPAGTATGTGYRVRVVSDAPTTYGTNNGSNLAISSAITTNEVTVSPADAQTIALAATGTTLTARAATGSTFTWAYGTNSTGPFNTPITSASGATFQPLP